ncbi:hypothetical protein K4A83_00540 [Spirulina subsalsa FACHB-351]|uniref:CRISPR type III-B/RAMP module-associated protein Cmr5 n=1 Tax=Spirulina subsalsa FACHB-351 TaxID=234711 RepID=A0ABT3L161_9CYAN|nr:hypothetical protein [Spirulina subsalsa]MCW6034765.1 hypothetical protein [Spirulina subsalsa FACHB-351]
MTTNLDRLAAKHAQSIITNTQSQKASDIENTVTKTLGVLQENGVYACFLYLLAKEKENGKVVVSEILNLLQDLNFGWNKPHDLSPDAVLKHITNNVTQNLERLLLTKETLEQMLIYARYGAKARQVAEKSTNSQQQEETP